MKKIFLLFTFIIVGVMSVWAEESEYITTVPNPGYTIDVSAKTGTAGASLDITLNGIDTSQLGLYSVYFSNTNSLPTAAIEIDNSGCKIDTDYKDFSKFKSIMSGSNGAVNITDDWYILDGYTYAYVVKRSSSQGKYYCEIISEPIVLTKPELPAFGQRYRIYIQNKQLSVFPYFPFRGETGDHKITTKIGIINDDSIVRKFAKGASDAYSSLLTYAKSNNGESFNYVDSDSYSMDLNGMTVQNGKYYFIYNTYTDPIYRNLEDVAIAMGKNSALTNDVVYNISEEEEPVPQTPVTEAPTTQVPTTQAPVNEETTTKKEEQENPKTGLTNNILILIVLILLSSLALISVKGKNFFIKN